MTASQPIREQIDACREGDGDLALPELAELARTIPTDLAVADELAHSRQFDRCVRAALNDTPVPGALAERLIAALQAEEAQGVVYLPTVGESQRPASSRRTYFSRRRMLLAGGGLALVALLGVGISQLAWSRRTIAQHELAADVGRLLASLNSKMWLPVAAGALPKGIALDSAIVAKPLQMQTLSYSNTSGWSATVTAVDLAPAGRPRAILFVVRSRARFAVPAAPAPASRLGLSGGFTAIAWQRNAALPLYVLVVEEDRGQRLDDYLSKRPEA